METKSKDQFHAKLAFYLSLGFWIPLFNVGLCLTSLYVALHAHRKIRKDPNKFSGFGYIIAALVLSLTGIVFTILGFLLFLGSEQICTSGLCAAIE